MVINLLPRHSSKHGIHTGVCAASPAKDLKMGSITISPKITCPGLILMFRTTVMVSCGMLPSHPCLLDYDYRHYGVPLMTLGELAVTNLVGKSVTMIEGSGRLRLWFVFLTDGLHRIRPSSLG